MVYLQTIEWLDEFAPYSVDDMLIAHVIMTRDLVEKSGISSTRSVAHVTAFSIGSYLLSGY